MIVEIKTSSLMDVVQEILKLNPNCILSGSLAMKLQGVKLRREPTDIDLYLPYGSLFNTIDKMVHDSSSHHYEETHYARITFKFNETKVDLFRPIESGFTLNYNIINGIKVLAAYEILGLKIQHCFDSEQEDTKHKEDLIFILQNN